MALTHIDGRAAGAEAPARALWLGAVPLGTTSARQLTIGNDTPLPLAYCWEPTAADIDSTSAAVGDAAGGCYSSGGPGGVCQLEQRHPPAVLSGVHGECLGSRGTEGGHAQVRRPAALQLRAGTQPTAGACSCGPETAADFRMQPAAGTLPANAAVTFTASFHPHLESGVSAFARFKLRVQPCNREGVSHVPSPLIGGAFLPEGQQGSALLRSDAMDASPCVPVVAQPVVRKAAGRAAACSADTIVLGCSPLAGPCAGSVAVEVTLEGLALPAPRLEAEPPVLQGCVRLAAGQARTPCSSCASRIVLAASMLRQQVLTQWALCAPGSSNKWTHMNCKLHNAAVLQYKSIPFLQQLLAAHNKPATTRRPRIWSSSSATAAPQPHQSTGATWALQAWLLTPRQLSWRWGALRPWPCAWGRSRPARTSFPCAWTLPAATASQNQSRARSVRSPLHVQVSCHTGTDSAGMEAGCDTNLTATTSWSAADAVRPLCMPLPCMTD